MIASRTIYLLRRRDPPQYSTRHDGSIRKLYSDGSGCIYHPDGRRSWLEARITDYDPGYPLARAPGDMALTVSDCLAEWYGDTAAAG